MPIVAGFSKLGQCFLPDNDALLVFEGHFGRTVLHASCFEEPSLVNFEWMLAQGSALVFISCERLLGSLELL